ncbi:MAG: hypothetical protein RL634_1840 [Bacteroidota bacterium]
MKIFQFLFWLLISQITFAHEGGHYHKGDGTVFNQWMLKNGEVIKGNFYSCKEDIIFIEQEEGKLLSIPLLSFDKQDQLLLKAKIKRIAQFNQIELPPAIGNHQIRYQYNLYLTILTFFILLLIYFFPFKRFIPSILQHQLKPIIASGVIFIYIIACSKKETVPSTSNNNNSNTSTSIPKNRISFLDSAYQAFKPTVSTSSDNTYYYVACNGLPAHNMMIGITSWQQQVPIPQAYTGSNSWSIPLQPAYATTPLSTKANLMKGAVAIAINGIPIFNALNNRGEDSYAIGELDNWGGHCGRADDYHYHAAPMHLNETVAKLPIAFGLDGFAVYGSKEPNGNSMNALDTCHGHTGDDGIYHYHGTTSYPYVIGAMKGKVNLDPATPAPENQILPQAFAKAARPALTPLKGAVITDFKANGSNGYNLTYKIGTKFGYVNYTWDANNKFTYTIIDTAGVSTTTSYQR